MIDIEKPRWRAAIACEVAGLGSGSPSSIRDWRREAGFRLGTLQSNGWRYSVLDVGELALAQTLRTLGLSREEAIRFAHGERRVLKGVLNDRLVHGFWSSSAVEVDDYSGPVHTVRRFYLADIGERVIKGLDLPLPVDPCPRNAATARKMADAILDYFFSPPGVMRWKKWRVSVIERGGSISFEKAAVELGAPQWFLRAVLRAGPQDNAIQIVDPRAVQVREQFEGVSLQ